MRRLLADDFLAYRLNVSDASRQSRRTGSQEMVIDRRNDDQGLKFGKFNTIFRQSERSEWLLQSLSFLPSHLAVLEDAVSAREDCPSKWPICDSLWSLHTRFARFDTVALNDDETNTLGEGPARIYSGNALINLATSRSYA